jgi:dimethylamine/trimethylamine dehydrogenase
MVRIAAYPHLGEWGRLVQYRRVQLDKLRNVEVILSKRLSAEDVLTYGAEIVITATGARWRADGMNGPTQAPIPGADADHVYVPEQVADAGGKINGDRVVVYDTDGYFTAVAMAQLLMEKGKSVTIITPFPNLGPYLFFTGEGFRVNRELRAAGVAVIPNYVVTEIDSTQLRGVHAFDPKPVAWEADAVVLVTQREPCDGLYRELLAESERRKSEGIEALYRIGDCVAPRLIADCVFDGHRLAREIDTDDPSVPLPYLRELPSRPEGRPALDQLVAEGAGG